MNIKKTSQNELEELFALISEFKQSLHAYSHVAEYLPKSLTSELDKMADKLNNEYDIRCDLAE